MKIKKLRIAKLLLFASIIAYSMGCEEQIYEDQNIQVKMKSLSTGSRTIKRTYLGTVNGVTSASVNVSPDSVKLKALLSIKEPPPPCLWGCD